MATILNNQKNKYNQAHKNIRLNFKRIKISKWPCNTYEATLKFLNINENTKILDAGCGEGRVLNELSLKSNYVYGIDISSVAIKKLKNYFKKSVYLKCAPLERLPFDSNFFDYVLLTDVLEHAVSRHDVIDELKRILKKNGKIIIITPNLCKLKNRIKFFIGKYPITSATAPEKQGYGLFHSKLYDAGHLQYFTFQTLQMLAELHNLKVVKKWGFGKFGRIHNFWPELFSGSIGMIMQK